MSDTKELEEPRIDQTPDTEEAAQPGVEEAAAETDQEDPLEAARQEATQYKDRFLRLAAEFENYKKRVARDFDALVESAAESVIRDLLPVLDAVGRALDHRTSDEGESDGYRQGVQMIMEQFPRVLQNRGLAEIEAIGQPFDPHVHEALMQMPSEEHEAGLVAQVVERGYRLGEKVLRPSKVVVSLGRPVQESDREAGEEGKA